MSTKADLIDEILVELTSVQGQPPAKPRLDHGRPWFPPMLPTGDGRSLPVSEKLLADVSSFADFAAQAHPGIATSLTKKDAQSLLRRAFGVALTPLDLDDDIEVNRAKVLNSIDNYLLSEFERMLPERTFLVGCRFLTASLVPDVVIGPVRFEMRDRWLERVGQEGIVSAVTARRLTARWGGRRTRRRRSAPFEQALEDDVVRAVGTCVTVCTVQTYGLGGKALESKALLAARLGLTTVSLLWPTPSKALEGLNLLFDGDAYTRNYLQFDRSGWRGSSTGISRLPSGPPLPENWDELWAAADWLVAPLGDAILGYVDPARQSLRPGVLNALFMSLWWFHEACREGSALLAAVKFAASMDALAKGGRRRGITRFIEARLGLAPGSPLTTNGRSTDEVVREVYDYARSRTIHGSNDRLGYDWTNTRDLAENLARLCLREACGWMHDNPASNDLDAMQVP